MLFTKEDSDKQEGGSQNDKVSKGNKDASTIWTLEFDGSYASSGSRVGVVLISLEGEPKPLAFKLEFGNTNNIA